jgi:hypothetical protein
MFRLLSTIASAALLAGCATPPLQPFPTTHPASPEAAEAPPGPPSNSLAPDEATQRTGELLAVETKPQSQTHTMPDMEMNSSQQDNSSHENH